MSLSRNNVEWNGYRNIEINSLITIDYFRSLGYEFKYEIPKKIARKFKLEKINE